MAIDNPLDAFEQQYPEENRSLPKTVVKYVGDGSFKLAFPEGLGGEILSKVWSSIFDREYGMERANAFIMLAISELGHLGSTKASHDDVRKAVQLGIWYDRHEQDDKKREYYIKLIGNAARSEEQINDIASFIQTLERLNERDVIVLKVVNKVTNRDGDWNASSHPKIFKLHPTTMRNYAEALSMEIASALSQNVQTNFSREEGYGICNRLQGFGLVHEVEVQPRELPLTNYCFRLSIQGVRLLKLLGEDVPNYHYFVARSV